MLLYNRFNILMQINYFNKNKAINIELLFKLISILKYLRNITVSKFSLGIIQG